ncbi:uncharacterized protein LOC119117888 [Syngnathus acus]|uniref:uncharacterized protein LOC119117888 n=1 Tax=Syngnathus acus TaxID=161584 RepID=UPI0018864A62|nr:uncharacterized protein LOC119117888 [Syngnathus acus]
MAKSLDLKVERTTAKRLLSRLANSIMRTHTEMSKEDLKENFKKLTLESSRVMDANEEMEAAYMAEAHVTTVEDLDVQLRTDLEKTEKDCEQKTREVKRLIQETLWGVYGGRELSLAIHVAEVECRNVSSDQPDRALESYEFMLTHLEKLELKAKEAHQNWNRWAPPTEQRDFDDRLRQLEVHLPQLVSRKAAFSKAAKMKLDADNEELPGRRPVAAIKLKATALPKFAGNQRGYYRWRQEWEALQKQGEPTGSKEMTSFESWRTGLETKPPSLSRSSKSYKRLHQFGAVSKEKS